MLNFDFYNPTRIVFGKDRLHELDKLVPANTNVLVLYGGGSVKKFGTLDKVKEALGTRNVFEFGGIEPNPAYETLVKAIELVRKENIDFLLAVGGGSVIDGTKFVAAGAHLEGDNFFDIFSGGQVKPAEITKAVPFGVVLTIPATGSEMNFYSVISHRGQKSKLPFFSELVFPQFSILDPTITFTLPKHQVANGIIDAFSHVFEQYLTYPVDARVQDRISEGLFQTLIEVGPQTVDNLQDYETRANLVWSATSALNGTTGAGVPQDWTSHMIGHELTALYGIDHAQTMAVVIPAVMKVRRRQKHAKLLQYADRVWNIREGSKDERIDAAIRQTQDFFESLGVKTQLSDYGLGAENIDEIINQLESHGMTALSETKDVTLDVSRKILEAAL
ncbi:iron-containing alcohol dehydrogenase [Peribacillus sp. NPDC096622]|uniref:iron-containing alcohol dehydrogenase n=1 Tax=Peribacillus sp. NPDC096622 TaxID=3364396 RepID=UPI0037F76C7F